MAASHVSFFLCKAALSETAWARVAGQRDRPGMSCPPAVTQGTQLGPWPLSNPNQALAGLAHQRGDKGRQQDGKGKD